MTLIGRNRITNVNDEIRAYLTSIPAAVSMDEVSDSDSLLESGIIDSMSMVDLIAHLEKTYDIQVAEDDMTPENFDSIEAIASYVGARFPPHTVHSDDVYRGSARSEGCTSAQSRADFGPVPRSGRLAPVSRTVSQQVDCLHRGRRSGAPDKG